MPGGDTSSKCSWQKLQLCEWKQRAAKQIFKIRWGAPETFKMGDRVAVWASSDSDGVSAELQCDQGSIEGPGSESKLPRKTIHSWGKLWTRDNSKPGVSQRGTDNLSLNWLAEWLAAAAANPCKRGETTRRRNAAELNCWTWCRLLMRAELS